MTAPAATVGAVLFPAGQAMEWATGIRHTLAVGGRVAVAHSSDRSASAHVLARGCGATRIALDEIHRMGHSLGRGDLVIVIVSAAAPEGHRPCLPSTTTHALHDLLQRGTVVWGMTGPRPNPVADHCHDTAAVPTADVERVLWAHTTLVGELVRSLEAGGPLPHMAGLRAI
jgi:hypothetical protein